MDFVINCDLKCLKEILNRQAGAPAHGCFCCDALTSNFQTRGRTRGSPFTHDTLISKSAEWVAEWQAKVCQPQCVMHGKKTATISCHYRVAGVAPNSLKIHQKGKHGRVQTILSQEITPLWMSEWINIWLTICILH